MAGGTVGVVGAGLMGAGIAQVASVAGYDVVMHDVDDAALERGRRAIAASQQRLVAKGALSADVVAAAGERVRTTTDLATFADCEFVVEAVFEDLATKRAVFGELEGIVHTDAVLATNTTAIPISQVAQAVATPERVVGTHFFSPVPVMKLCELVRGEHTSDTTLRRAREFAESVGKTCIVVERDVAGFVTSRLLVAFLNEAMSLVESGVATAEDIDTACKLGFGHAMGPLATLDLTGLDVIAHAAAVIYEETGDAKFAPPPVLLRMVADGELGRKAGRGFYRYEQ